MALQKDFESAYGVSGNYWVITLLVSDPIAEHAQCKVSVFKDQAARIAGKTPLATRGYSWEGEEYPFAAVDLDPADTNPYKISYAKLKTLPEFDGAIDV